MIYEFPDTSAFIRQGDIFVGLPLVNISLNKVIVVGEKGESEEKWADIAPRGESVYIIVPARPVAAIVATQDCDAIRSRYITLCEIRSFTNVELKSKDTTSANKFQKLITQQARINQKWFYLPPDSRVGFLEKMAVDFMVTLRLPRAELEELKELRKGRLNKVADEHFRERIGEFFRRYPYDEWYPLNQKELAAYQKDHSDVQPFPWQQCIISSSAISET